MSIEQPYNFKIIDAQTTSSGAINTEQLHALGGQNYQVVINLLPNDNRDATANEQKIVEQQGIDYVYIPVDFTNPKEDDYQQFANAMTKHHAQKTHIHCAANYRASAFYAIYAHQHLGWTVTEAKQHIESLWQPREHPQWLALLQNNIPGYE